MRWQVLVGVVTLAAFLGSAELALAAAGVSLDPRPDGTLVLVGSGWRPGQELDVSLGTDTFSALADSSGSFEVPTGLLVASGPPLSITVRRKDTTSLAFAQLGAQPQPDTPNAYAILFAESMALGARALAVSAGGLGLASLAVRAIRARSRAS